MIIQSPEQTISEYVQFWMLMKIPSLSPLFYVKLVYGATFLTGFASLCGQVVWQKYLAILAGSEAKSMSLVVAIFLFGLASGYYFFGKLTEKNWSRRLLLKVYGLIELATALYILLFPLYFYVLKFLSFNAPPFLIADIFISLLALFFPTFLMGASIPLLTAVLPSQPEDINSTHTQIYGWNTLGAFAGTLISGFFLIPFFGFSMSLIIVGIVNLLASLIFIFNPLEGDVKKQTDIQLLPSSLSNRLLAVFVFFTGAVIISCEILFIRLLNISVGAGTYNFPIVLSLFVGGLGLGSLLIPKKISIHFFIRQVIFAFVFLFIAYATAPYWSIWLSHLRVSLRSILFNYYLYKLDIFLFLFIFIFPISFFMGRLLPLAYAFLKKTKDNYAQVCGSLYFLNTLGTVFGAVLLGYVLFYFLDLNRLFEINLMILIILAGLFSIYEKKRIQTAFIGVLAIGFIVFPFFIKWNRSGHVHGYFRDRSPNYYHFHKLFYLPQTYNGQLSFFKDGPNTTVAITENDQYSTLSTIQSVIPQINSNYTVFVNGKSDGSFIGSDFATVVLLASFGYLFAPDNTSLSSAVVGLGTGISAGLLGKMQEIKEVKVLEISSQVIQGLKSISSYKFDVMSNPKIDIIEQDAFKYFTRTSKKFDLIVSEPSNPWVIGIENLFSLEFYQLALKKLNKNGVLVQWLHTYSMDEKTMEMIFTTIKQVFNFAEFYVINNSDVLIIASSQSFWKNTRWRSRFFDPHLFPIHKAFGFKHPEDYHLLRVFGNHRLSTIARHTELGIHSLTRPKLTYKADQTFFTGEGVNELDISEDFFFEDSSSEKPLIQQFAKYTQQKDLNMHNLCLPASGFTFFCTIMSDYLTKYRTYQNSNIRIKRRFTAYTELRKRGLVAYDAEFLELTKQSLIFNKTQNTSMLIDYINQILSHKNYTQAFKDISDFKSTGMLTNQSSETTLLEFVLDIQKIHSVYN